MFNMGSYSLCWFLLVICLHQVTPQPIMNLSDFVSDPNNVINNSLCSNELENDKDFFTVRGKVNKNGANPAAYTDTNLYLQAVADPSTNAWASQCRPDLTVCRSNLTTECYCERKDANGDYHLVMTIMAKYIYSDGKLILSWNDARSPYNQPILSNQVDYYPGPISKNINVTLEFGSTEVILDVDNKKTFHFDIEPNTTRATFCVYNLRPNSLIEIKDSENNIAQTTTDSCVTLNFTDESPSRVLTTYFRESGGCERTDSFTINLGPGSKEGPPPELDAGEIVGITLGCVVAIVLLVCLCCYCCYCCCIGGATKSRDDDKESLEKCESSSDFTTGQTCKCSIFTKMNDCFLVKMKGCKAAPEVTMEKGEIKEQNRNQGRHRLDTGMAKKTATPRKLPPIDNVSRSNHRPKSESTNDILDVNANRKKKKKKKKIKGTEAANEGATDHEKIKAQNGTQGKQNGAPMMTRDNTSPRTRPLPKPRNQLLSSNYEKKMIEKNTEGTEAGLKRAIDNDKVKAQDRRIGDQRGDMVVFEKNTSRRPPVHLPQISNTYLRSNYALEYTISNDKSVAEVKKKKKKKRKGTEIANEGAVEKEQTIAQDGSNMREKRPVPLPRNRYSPLMLNKRRMSATSTN